MKWLAAMTGVGCALAAGAVLLEGEPARMLSGLSIVVLWIYLFCKEVQ